MSEPQPLADAKHWRALVEARATIARLVSMERAGWHQADKRTAERDRARDVAVHLEAELAEERAQADYARRHDGQVTTDWPNIAADPWPNIGDTCCGRCTGGTCYVDQVTGA